MAGAGERAYVFARACGIISKSWVVRRRIAPLRAVNRLAELDRLIFAGSAKELPEKELLRDLEGRLIRRSVAQIVSIIGSYKHPPEVLIRLLKVYEYADLKTIVALARDKVLPRQPPDHADISPYAAIRHDAWPDLAAMLEGSEYAFIIDRRGELAVIPDGKDGGITVETALDRDYYGKLWKSLFTLKKSDRVVSEKIIREEIALRNCAWVLRLRTYYGMKADEVRRHLVTVEGEHFTADAEAALELPLDNREAWTRWKRFNFLNGGAFPWRADPRFFQNGASEYLYRLAMRNMRVRPLSIDTAFCFIKLKQFEEDLLTSYAEGLALGMSSEDFPGVLEAAW
ncbi:MAG: V-type ATPase subunit [Treponema sp.]|jgi:vacuolar-type H+-ATPase subunit C/Vma6|nr:V-type ATPase subunit [Treponema sp.]